MLPVEWSDEAQDDLSDIQSYIKQRNPAAALKLRALIESGIEKLPLMPQLFRLGRVAGTREYVAHPNYIVIYRVERRSIVILRILHARQQYP